MVIGLHLAMTGEPRGFSRVAAGFSSYDGNSGCLLCWPREVQSSIRVAKESWGLLSSDCRADRPHLGLCPEAEVPLQGRPGSRGGIPDAPGETGIHLDKELLLCLGSTGLGFTCSPPPELKEAAMLGDPR